VEISNIVNEWHYSNKNLKSFDLMTLLQIPR
jgi:hypothetical protein